MPDYSKGKIYKIVCNTTGQVYIGSTVQLLAERLRHHKTDYKRFHEGKTNYTSSFAIIERGNYEILLVESYSCNSRQELHQRERFYIEHEQCVNKIIPCRSQKEYRQEHRDKISERMKKYYQDNRDKKIEYLKEWYRNNKEQRKAYDKEYYENHKEQRKAYNKERSKLRVECHICNCTVVKKKIREHERTLKHLRNLASRV